MKYGIILIILLILVLPRCQPRSDKLFWVSQTTGQQNDFLYLAESTNVPTIKGDSLRLFLNPEEIRAMAIDSSTVKNFGCIHRTERFRVHILLFSMDSHSRFYCFVIRTYDLDFNIIDDFELAAWAEREKQYCFGSIDNELVIERSCNYNETRPNRMKIAADGKMLPF